MLKLDINLVFTVINVLLLFVVVRVFLLKPIRKIIAARQEEADAALAQANEEKEEAHRQQAQVEEQMKGIEAERLKLLAETRAKAGQEYDRVLSDAKKEAGEIITHARKNAEEERERILVAAKEDVAELVAAATTKLVTGSDSPENDRELYDTFLKKAAKE